MVKKIIKGYRIKICNSQGCQLSGIFNTKREAILVINKNRDADKRLNQKGLRSQSTGRLIKIRNKYSLVKV